VNFRTTKRVTPTITFYNPAAANAQARNGNLGTDYSSTALATAVVSGFGFNATSPTSTIAGAHSCAVEWAANSEF
jgi:hypothetical protein